MDIVLWKLVETFEKLAAKKTAIIIKGNPKFIKNNNQAKSFYKKLKTFIEGLGYTVSFDEGKPYTEPEKADVWIGHSRGADRLRFAPKSTITIAVGSPERNGINHPKDNAVDPKRFTIKNKNRFENFEPNKYHYILSEEMKEKIEKKLSKKV